jgi:hypothetical protein
MEQNVNKKFSVSDALYQSVMEVMKGSREGSTPRNEKEKDLAKFHGDPNRITHGDVLKARGVTKEEVENVDEISSGLATSYLNKREPQHKPDLNSPETNNRDTKVAKGISSAGRRALGFGPDKNAANKVTGRFNYRKNVGATHTFNKEEVENVDEMSSKMKMKLGLYGKKKKTNEESVEEGMMDNVKTSVKKVAKKAFKALTGGSDKEQLQALRKRMGMKEGKDTPGNSYEHQCAIHVKSESFGEGRTITTQHADPDAEGNIAWYDVMFEHGIEKQVPTSALEILVSESHMHSKKKKAM